MGHRRHSRHRLATIQRLGDPDPFARELLDTRREIEMRFANLCNFGGGLITLPPWARSHRVEAFVTAKLAIRLARDNTQRRLTAA